MRGRSTETKEMREVSTLSQLSYPEENNERGEANDGVEEEGEASKRMRMEGQNEEENHPSHETTNKKRKDTHKQAPPPEDELMANTRPVKPATGTKVSLGHLDQKDGARGENSEERNERNGHSSSSSERNGDGQLDGQGNEDEQSNGQDKGYGQSENQEGEDGQSDYQGNGSPQLDGQGNGDRDWDPVTEPDGYDPYAPVDFVTHATYYYRKAKTSTGVFYQIQETMRKENGR